MLLRGKTAVISGASSARGIGRATAKLFAEHGARVAILGLDGARQAAAELGAQHLGSDLPSYVTGAVIDVNGGMLIH